MSVEGAAEMLQIFQYELEMELEDDGMVYDTLREPGNLHQSDQGSTFGKLLHGRGAAYPRLAGNQCVESC